MTTSVEARPEVEFDKDRYRGICDAYRHEDGSITYIVYDDSINAENPRLYDGNVAVLIQKNTSCIDIDDDDAGLREAHERLSEAGMRRYLAMFRPDILYYENYWSAGESHGWGYITRETWEKAMYPTEVTENTVEAIEHWLNYEPSVTPKEAFDVEVDLYRQWAAGEVYGAYHVTVGDPIVELGEHGAFVDGYHEGEESCWGFLGYDDHQDVARQFTDSPITEVLY